MSNSLKNPESLGEAVLKVGADTSEFEEAMQRCLGLVEELSEAIDKLQVKIGTGKGNDDA